MVRNFRISLFDMVICLSSAMDLISQDIVDHHKQVAYIAFSIAGEMGLPFPEQDTLLLAGLIHDCGAFYLTERLNTLKFEMDDPHKHARVGYVLLKTFEPFRNIAELVRYHHVNYDSPENKEKNIPFASHILHLADRISILIDKTKGIMGQINDIYKTIEKYSGEKFSPEAVQAFKSLSKKEYFWLDCTSQSIISILHNLSKFRTIELNMEEIINLGKLFCHIIDFRSHFTATHSSGVAASAEALARYAGFSERERQMMLVAGYLHDLGKLAVPTEVLEKPGKLNENEFNIIRCHTYYTYRTLEYINEFNMINEWASFHHERLDGSGYPFHINGSELTLGSKIMAVADVFTALAEDRPYRMGMTSENIFNVLQNMIDNSGLDNDIFLILKNNYDAINNSRINAQREAANLYRIFELES